MAMSVYNPEGSRVMTRELTRPQYQFDRNLTRNPDKIITIFTVNTREQYSTSGKVKFAGRDQNERYLKVGSITDPKYYIDDENRDGTADQKKVNSDDGQWVAMDWLNPANLFSLDQDFVVTSSVNDGTNLLERGVFFIVRPYTGHNGDDKPTEKELAAAERRLTARYNALVRLYQQTSAASPSRLPNIINEEMIDALNALGIKTPYNSTLEQKVPCVNCGEMKMATAKFHKSEGLGVICIDPSVEGWKAAVAAGIKKRDEVPDDFKWPGRTAA